MCPAFCRLADVPDRAEIISDLEATAGLVKVVETYEPDADRHAMYQKNFRIFTELYRRLQDLM